MRILFLADGRSPIALNWIRHFTAGNHDVHLVSLFPCAPDLALASLTIVPVAFSGLAGEDAPSSRQTKTSPPLIKRLARWAVNPQMRTVLRHAFVPHSLPRAAHTLRDIVKEIQPDLVHAMRIPFEGMTAALALEGLPAPLLVSVWGNDFTLHAASSHTLGELTTRTLRRADALHTDCLRDRDLAFEWGFAPHKPAAVLPGGGGVQTDLFRPPEVPAPATNVINPRGLRAYVRTDTFFQAVPAILAGCPEARFLCPGMAASAEAEAWLRRTAGASAVELLPRQTRPQMAALFRRAGIVLSITEHDGTPNTLLEALACGCFPIVGDIPSLREWIRPGENGLLVPPGDAAALAQAVLRVIDDGEMRAYAYQANQALIAEKAEHGRVMAQAAVFYEEIIR